MARVLVVGLDPAKIEGWDPEPVQAAIARGRARFMVRQHAPDAAIAFNSSPEDCADAAQRWLR